MDKTVWQTIVNNDYMLSPQQSITSLTPELLTNLGSTNLRQRE